MQDPKTQTTQARRLATRRERIKAHHAAMRDLHRGGAGGLEFCRANTRFFDELVAEAFSAAVAACPGAPAVCLCATGSFGRGEMAPYSDLDLLFLLPDGGHEAAEPLIGETTRALWDLGLEAPHAARTVEESVAMATRDATILTTLLDSRLLAGDDSLLDALERGIRTKIDDQTIEPTIPRRPEEGIEPGYPAGAISVIEPDLKGSPGTLRDFHMGLWTARIRAGTRTLADVEHAAMIPPRVRIEVEGALDFLLRIRNAVHYAHGRKADRLVVDIQEEVAEALGYVAVGRRQEVEALLRDYYKAASSIWRFSRELIEHCARAVEPRKMRRLEAGFRADRDELYFSRKDAITRDPVALIRAFRVAAEHGLTLSADARREIRAARYRIDEDFRERADAASEFLRLLACDRAAPALREMHETEVLDDYLPEFGDLRHRVAYDYCHRFTVDEHTLLGVHFFERLGETERADARTLVDLYRRTYDRQAVKLAILIHDMGKAGGPGHTERGLRLIPLIAHRLHLDERTTRKIEHMVRHHMLMNELALKRDIHDVRVLRGFVEQVPDERYLNRLFLITYADMRAVGPGVWNAWNAALLDELYWRARKALTAPLKELGTSYYARLRDDFVRKLEGRTDPDVLASYFARLPERFISWLDPDRILWHLEILDRFRDHPTEALVRRVENVGYYEILVVSRDRQGLFSHMTGVVTAQGLNILGAQVYTLDDGVILDTLQVEPVPGRAEPDEAELAEAVRRDLTDVLEGRRTVGDLIEDRPRFFSRRVAAPAVEPTVLWDNGISDAHTIIEVNATDRPGLLHEITDPIREAGLSIYLAKINTEGHRVADVFYLTDERGKKVKDADVLDGLIATIRRVIEPKRRPSR